MLSGHGPLHIDCTAPAFTTDRPCPLTRTDRVLQAGVEPARRCSTTAVLPDLNSSIKRSLSLSFSSSTRPPNQVMTHTSSEIVSRSRHRTFTIAKALDGGAQAATASSVNSLRKQQVSKKNIPSVRFPGASKPAGRMRRHCMSKEIGFVSGNVTGRPISWSTHSARPIPRTGNK